MINLNAIGQLATREKLKPLMTQGQARDAGLGQNTGFTGNKGSTDPRRNQRAGEVALAQVAANRQQTYSDVYQPTSDALRDMATGKGPDVRERLSEVGATAAKAFDSNTGTIGREQRALGLTGTGNQGKRLSLRRLISEVDARNNEAGSLREQQVGAQEYSIQQQASLYDQQSSIFSSISQSEAQRKSDEKVRAAQQQSQVMGAAGLALSVAMMM